MQKLIDKISTQVESFIEQRRNLVMVLSCTNNEVAMSMKIISDVEEANSSDVYFFFADDFKTQEGYVNNIIDKLYVQYELANQEAKKEGLELLQEPPSELKDKNIVAIQRLGKAMMYTRSLVPNLGAHKVIWVLYPQEIHDREVWHELLSSYTPKKGIQDGMQGLRIIFRDLPKTLDFSPYLEKLSRIQFNFSDMSPGAIEEALDETVNDESLPDNQRYDAMLQKAMVDSAHGRFDQAYDAFKYMLGHYQKTENHAVQAVIINSVGNIYRRKNQLDDANTVFETATEPSIKSGSATVLHNTALNLADNEFARKNYEKSCEYYDTVDQLASKMLYADGKIYSLNQQAECSIKLDDWKSAIKNWDDVTIFCREGEYFEDLEVALKKLINAREYVEVDALKKYLQEFQELKEEV